MKKYLTFNNILILSATIVLTVNSILRYQGNKNLQEANKQVKQLILQDKKFITKVNDLDTSMQNYFSKIDSTNKERKQFLNHLKVCKHK